MRALRTLIVTESVQHTTNYCIWHMYRNQSTYPTVLYCTVLLVHYILDDRLPAFNPPSPASVSEMNRTASVRIFALYS